MHTVQCVLLGLLVSCDECYNICNFVFVEFKAKLWCMVVQTLWKFQL